jgi:spore coat protein U-like protein
MMKPWTAILALSVMGLDFFGLQRKPPAPTAGTRTCAITATGVDFGVYETTNSVPADSTGTITYSCSQGGGALNVTVTIDSGFGASFNRTMTNGTDRMNYNLYLDAGRTTIWGDGSSGTNVLTDKVPGNSKQITATVYGRVFPRQNVGSGQYADGLTVTLLF